MVHAPLARRLLVAAVATSLGTGCTALMAAGPVSDIIRGQAPDGPKAPTGPLVVPELTVTPTSLSATAPTAPSIVSATDPFRDKQVSIAAYIGTSAVITEDEVWHMVRQRPEMRQLSTLSGGEREVEEKKLFQDELKKILDRELVIIEMLARLKKNSKNPELMKELQDHAEKVATSKLTQYRKANKFASDAEFGEALKSQGITLKGIRRQLERDALAEIYLMQTLKDKPKQVTLADVWEYYAAHPVEFAVEDRVRWQDLFIAFDRFQSKEDAKKYGDSVWRQATTGADFPQLVTKFGHGDSNLRGGDGVGTKKGEIQPRELEPVLFDMDAGQVSGLLQTATGYHLVKMIEHQKSGTRPFDEKVQVEIREKLAGQVRKVEYDRMLDELWRKHRPKVVN